MSPRPERAIKIALIEPEPLHAVLIDELIRLGGVPSARTPAAEADIILLGFDNLGDREMDFIESLHGVFSDTPIVVLSGTNAGPWSGEAVRLGAQLVLAKGELTSDKLASAIRFYACYVNDRGDAAAIGWSRPEAPSPRFSYAEP
jgi:DNA-binding NarL/FixJ family response regulator